jgi:hypothetical protein
MLHPLNFGPLARVARRKSTKEIEGILCLSDGQLTSERFKTHSWCTSLQAAVFDERGHALA